MKCYVLVAICGTEKPYVKAFLKYEEALSHSEGLLKKDGNNHCWIADWNISKKELLDMGQNALETIARVVEENINNSKED